MPNDVAVGAILACRIAQREKDLMQERAELRNPSLDALQRDAIEAGIAQMQSQHDAYLADADYLAYAQAEADKAAEVEEEAAVEVSAIDALRADVEALRAEVAVVKGEAAGAAGAVRG